MKPSMKSMRKIFLALPLVLLTLGAPALAGEVSLIGGGSFGLTSYGGISSPSGLLGGEVAFGTNVFEIGGFYDNNFLSYNGGGTGILRFFGGVARIGAPEGPFIDGKLGLTNVSAGTSTSDLAVGFAVGAGLRLPVALDTSLSPKIEYRYVPQANSGATLSRSTLDLAVMLSIGF